MGVNKSVHIEGMSDAHRWESQKKYLEEYDHILWKRYESDASGAGHGGMDFFLIHSLVECAKRNQGAALRRIRRSKLDGYHTTLGTLNSHGKQSTAIS